MYAPEDKDPPEGKELPNLFGSYISKVRPYLFDIMLRGLNIFKYG